MLDTELRKRIEAFVETFLIRDILDSSDFYFVKAQEAFHQYMDYKSGEKDFFVDLSAKSYEEIQELAEIEVEVNEFYTRIERLVSYCDRHAKDKNRYNQYEDKRVIAMAGIRQNAWIAQLIKYRIDQSQVTQTIHNVFDFINRPQEAINILSETHRRMVANNLYGLEYNRETFVRDTIAFFEPLQIKTKNPDNLTYLYTRIIYFLKDIWYDIVKGLVARDNGKWKDGLVLEMVNQQYGVLWWWPRPVLAGETLPKLEERIKQEGFFYIYYATYGKTTHRGRVIDFSLAEHYHNKSERWKEKDPVWYSEKSDGYNDGTRSASIMFLIDEFIEIDDPFPIEDFKMYKTVSLPNRNNLAPYSLIRNREEQEGGVSIASIPNLTYSVSSGNFCLRDKDKLECVLGADDMARELAYIIDNISNEQGRMIGIFGEWGRGKTFLMTHIAKHLEEKRRSENKNPIHKVDFHAWKYQDTPAIWAYLYEKFAAAYYGSAKNKIYRLGRRLKLNFKRLGYWDFIRFWIIFALSLAIKVLIPEEMKINIAGLFGISVLISAIPVYYKYKNPARELFRKYYTKQSFTSLLGIQAEVQKELKILVKTWAGKKKDFKIFLFVDDIDRCSEEKIIQIIDSLRVMLEDEELSEKLIVITAIDERILKRAIGYKYCSLWEVSRKMKYNGSRFSIKELVREYMDKLFITGIKLGNLNPEEKDEFLLTLIKADRDKENEPVPFSQLYRDEKEFVPEPVDYSMIGNEEEETDTDDPEVEEENQADISKGDSDAVLLTEDELKMLRLNLQSYDKITPRQIRIFYYRYLMARNLLIKQYEKAGRRNSWVDKLDKNSQFVELLIKFSKHDDPDIISKEKLRVVNMKEKTCIVELLDNEEFDTGDYKILIGVLDTVIGY